LSSRSKGGKGASNGGGLEDAATSPRPVHRDWRPRMHEEHSASTALSSAGQDNDRLAYSVAEAARRLDVSRMTLDRAGEVVAYDCWSARHRSASASMIRPRAAAACKRSVWARPAWPRRAARTLGPRPGATPSPGGAPQPRGRCTPTSRSVASRRCALGWRRRSEGSGAPPTNARAIWTSGHPEDLGRRCQPL
jgi:hypothetical protein